MTPFKRILFPVDFSAQCLAAGPHALAMVRHFNADLTLLHVIDALPLECYGMDPSVAVAAYAEMAAMSRRGDLDLFLKDQLSGLTVKRVVAQGNPASVITEYARNNAAQLIMMPTHGYGPFRRFLLGSVTAKVLHDADCPVWTSAHVQDDQGCPPAACRKVLCAVDLTEESVFLIRSAAEIAGAFDATLRLVHALTPKEMAENFLVDAPPARALFDRARGALQQLREEAGASAQVSIESGEIHKVVGKVARRCEADLVVIGRGRIHKTLGNLRTHGYAILRDSPCPVLSVCAGMAYVRLPVEERAKANVPLTAMG